LPHTPGRRDGHRVRYSLNSEFVGVLERGKLIEVDLSRISEINSFGFQLPTLLKKGTRTQKFVNICNHSEPLIRLLDVYCDAGTRVVEENKAIGLM
jgi:ABC-type transporter Mla MlaB component